MSGERQISDADFAVAETVLRAQVAELLRDAREQRGVPQVTLAARVGLSHPRLSDYESGRRTSTLRTISRILLGLGREIKIGVERMGLRDPAGERLQALPIDERVALSPSGGLLHRLEGFNFVIDGMFAALLHAVPVQAPMLELAVADVDGFHEWLRRVGARRFVPDWNVWAGDPDPQEVGPLVWRAVGGKVVANAVTALPPSVPVAVAGRTVPVRALWDLELDDLAAAAAVRRARSHEKRYS